MYEKKSVKLSFSDMNFSTPPVDAKAPSKFKVGSFSVPKETHEKQPPLKKARLNRQLAFSALSEDAVSLDSSPSKVTKEALDDSEETEMSCSESGEDSFELAKDEIIEILREEIGPVLSSLPSLETIIREEVRNYLVENGKALFHLEFLAVQKADLKKSSKHKTVKSVKK